MSPIMEDDENTTFSDINETSQKSMCVVVIATFMSYCRNWILWQYILLQQKIFRYTSAWLHRTYVVAKLVIAMLALVSATTMVVASTTHCHAECDCNTPQLLQPNTIWCNRLLPLRYKQPRSLSQRSQFCCVSSILNRKWAYCDDFWTLGYEIFLVVLATLDVWLVFVWIFFWLNNISKANMPYFLLHWASHKHD